MRLRLSGMAFAAAALLSGCVAYAPRPLDLAALRTTRQNASLGDSLGAQALVRCGLPAAAGQAWDKAALTCIALARSPRLQENRQAVDSAAAAVTTAAARRNPTLSIAADRALGSASLPWLLGFTLDLPLDGGARRALRIALADNGARGALLDYAEQSWSLRRDAHAALRSLLLSQRRLALDERLAVTAAEWLTATELRIAAGEAAAGERLPPRAAASRAAAESAQAGQRLAEARAQLAQLLGIAPQALQALAWDSAWTQPATPAPVADALVEQTLANRLDLQRALLDYEASELQLQQEIKLQYPQVSIGPGYTFDHGLRKLTFSLSLTLPLFDHNSGPIAQAEARRRAAGLRVEMVQAAILSELQTATAGVVAAQAGLAAAQVQRAAAAQGLARSSAARDAGAEDRSAAAAAGIDALDAQLAELSALENALSADAALEDALRLPRDGAERALNLNTAAGDLSAHE